MPTDMSKYPANWQEIRAQILRRAGGDPADPRVGARCEMCGLLNYAVGHRNQDGAFFYENGDDVGEEEAHLYPNYKTAREAADYNNETSSVRYIVIVLTIAHIDNPDPMDCRPENLKALCQRCHNKLDIKLRTKNRQRTAIKKEIARGQLTLDL